MIAMDLLYRLNDADEEAFLAALSPADRERLLRAYRWWGTVFNAKLPAQDAVDGRKFPRQIDTLRNKIQRAIEQETPIRDAEKTNPKLKAGVRAAEKTRG